MIGLTVRPASRADLPVVTALANEFNAALGQVADRYEVRRLSEYCFGGDAFLHIMVAEAVGQVRGYAIYHRAFDPFLAAPMFWMADLYVMQEWRRRGFGEALMAGIAAQAEEQGVHSLWWAVDRDNTLGQNFYRRLGASDGNDFVYLLDTDALSRLAATHHKVESAL